MSESPLSRLAGPIALAAGGLFVVTDLGRFFLKDTDNKIGMLTDPVFRVFNSAYFFAFAGLLISLIAVYRRMELAAGRFGFVAFCAAILGTTAMAGDMWFDGFVTPWMAEVLPQAFNAEKTTILLIGAASSYLLFALGWVLFGIASLRARVFPVAISVATIVAGVLGFQAGAPPFGVPIGLVMAALGGWLIYSDRAARRLPAPAIS